MGNLLSDATAIGFGPVVQLTSKFTGIDITGMSGAWFASVYYSQTNEVTDFVPVVEPGLNPMTGKGYDPPNYLRISHNGPINFSFLPAQGYIRLFLEGGRTGVTVNADLLTEA